MTELEHPLGRIVDGYKVNISDVPWQVSLQLEDYAFHYCGGAIISPRWILTAAHCLHKQSAGDMNVRVGATRVYEEGQKIRSAKLIVHEKYGTGRGRFDYDFGLVELATDLVYNDKVRPIALPSADMDVLEGTMVTVNGWGLTSSWNGRPSDVLLGVKIPIVDRKVCQNVLGRVNPVTDRMICAGFRNSGSNSKSQNVVFVLVQHSDSSL